MIAALTCAAFVLCNPALSHAQCSNPAGQTGEIIYNSSEGAFQGCKSNDTWQALHTASGGGGGSSDPCDPSNSPSAGHTCDDGSIYAGLSPDGNVAMYTTPADAPSTYTWNDGTTNHNDMSMANCTDDSPGTAATCQTGEANTAFLVGATGEPDYPFAAADYCDGLSAHGYDDWYLPAQDELNVLYTNKNTGDLNGTFDESGSWPSGLYWASSEYSNFFARYQRFSDGIQSHNNKNDSLSVRCVRKGYVAPAACQNPTGRTGEIIYNSSEDVLQGCTSDGWQALHAAGGGGGSSDPCDPANSPSVGQTCDDGSYFIGDIGAGPVYATNESFESSETWNDGNYNDYSTTGATSTTDGEGNTAILVTADSDDGTAGTQPHDAAIYCDSLSAHDHDDWYLPALEELNLFWNGGSPVANVDESSPFPAGHYWSSSEDDVFHGRVQRFNDGVQNILTKDTSIAVRCTRSGYFVCQNPSGSTGEIIYNTSADVYQACTANGWQALHQ